jgi:hypothetical protein
VVKREKEYTQKIQGIGKYVVARATSVRREYKSPIRTCITEEREREREKTVRSLIEEKRIGKKRSLKSQTSK